VRGLPPLFLSRILVCFFLLNRCCSLEERPPVAAFP
jgi:hypothetical protein